MKKLFGIMLLCVASAFALSSCSDDEEQSFDYPMESLYGTWDATHVKIGSDWNDYDDLFSITFNEDGTCYSDELFESRVATYETKGKYIYTYVKYDGEVYTSKCLVKSLKDNKAEIELTEAGSSEAVGFKLEKR